METRILNQEWKDIWVVELNDAIFNIEFNQWLVHRALIYQLSNARINVAHTKTRSDRHGSTRKLYKQKGTWRARAWSSRSPVRKKGWVAFWPRNNQNFTILMNKKERRKALFCVLSSKLKDNNLLILDWINFDTIRTKNMVEVLSKMPSGKKYLISLASKNEVIEKSTSNLPYAKTILVDYLNLQDLLKYDTLILLKDGIEKINNLLK